MTELKADLAVLYLKTGLKNIGITFLMSDSQVAEEKFLVVVNDMLASGEIADLLPDDQVENVVSAVRNEVGTAGTRAINNSAVPIPVPQNNNNNAAVIGAIRHSAFVQVKQLGIIDSKENCWKFFIDRVRGQLRCILCFSPVGMTLRIRVRKFPAIVNCTAINWFQDWPQKALESVSARFLEV